MVEKCKNWISANKSDLFTVLIIVLASLTSFAMGRLSALKEEKFPIKIEGASVIKASNSPDTPKMGEAVKGSLVASKNGTAYHMTTCPGAKQIKEENKIYFNSKEDAEKAGYRPAANCPGL